MNTRSSYLALVGLGIVNFLGCLDLTIVNTALPAIQNSFSVNETSLQWVMNALLLALAAFMVLSGKLADRYGRRRLLYLGMLLFVATSLGAGMADHFGMLVFWRFFQGIAIAILYTAPVALVPAVFPNKTGKAMGILFGIGGFGLALGPVIGGFLTSLLSWHAIFFINLPLTLLGFLFCYGNLPEAKSAHSEKIDLPGAILIAIMLPLIIFTTVKIHNFSWVVVAILYLISLILVALFVAYEKRIQAPIIDFHLFASRKFIVGLVANFFIAFFYAVDFFFIPLHLHSLGYESALEIGLIILPTTLMVAFLSPLSGTLCDRFGAKRILMTGYGLLAVSALLQAQFHASHALVLLLVPYCLFGIGWAFILSPSLITAVSSVPENMAGVAMGSVGTWHNFGGTVGLAIGSMLGYAGAMGLILATSLLSFVIITIGLD